MCLNEILVAIVIEKRVLVFLISIFFLRESLNNPVFDDDDDFIYVTKTIFDDDIPVIASDKDIIRPYKDSEIKIIRYFYDKDDDISKQQESLIFYENTYMQNSGVDYGGKENFEVISVLDGTVINVNEDNMLGKTIEIRHSNELISVYQSLSFVSVKKGDNVKQGQTIGNSGTCNVGIRLKDHLHFEIIYNGRVIDPESVYDKTIKEL